MKVASRFMLPTEMLLGWITFVLGVIGANGGGTLHRAMAERGACTEWLLLFCSIGLSQVVLAVFEWRLLRGADLHMLHRSSRARTVIAAGATMLWFSGISWLIIEGLARTSMMVVMIAPIVGAFEVWAFVENKKVTYALDPRIPTSRLQFHR